MKKRHRSENKRKGGRQPGEWKLLTPEKLVEFRQKHHISRSRLAKMLGVSATSVQNWDMGKCPPNMKFQARLVEIMAQPGLVTDQAPRAISGILRAAEGIGVEMVGQIVVGWLKSNPHASQADLVKVVKGVRDALR
jgi:DNA-binding transcriptional regulator YiaG